MSSTAPAINPVTQPVTLQVGTFATTIPPGSFKKIGGSFIFVGVIDGVRLKAQIRPTGTLRYAFHAEAKARELGRDHEPGVCDPDHRRRQRRDLGRGPHSLKTRAGLIRFIGYGGFKSRRREL